MPTIPANSRVPELDALRGLAALGVVVWHYGAHFGARPFEGSLYVFYHSGFLLVDFFFVLSGYVIAKAYWLEDRRHRLGKNIYSRIARLYPLHFVTLLLVAALAVFAPPSLDPALPMQNNDAFHFVLNLLLLNNIGLQHGWSFNTPAWSISTEFVANLLFLTFISFGSKARLLALCVATSFVLVLYLAGSRPYIEGNHILGFIDANLARCILGFGAGVAVYLVLHRLALINFLSRNSLLCTIGGLAFVALFALILFMSGRSPGVSYYAFSIAASTGVILLIPSSRLFSFVLNRKPLRRLGDISYSVYLLHYPIQLLFFSLVVGGWVRLDFSSYGVFVFFMSLVVILSALTYRYIELPAKEYLLNMR